ncbi:orotidine-5'-phosphate decarboxylase [Frankia sp. AgB1.9]|uniref:orotidine-5'-phosphate decarboxylase n=1 Tax=unclassified Frankia TaxID=2632575 RepID=UPI001931DA7D|nr:MULTISPECIES: orotidine-5'-phosphate decarboxylase [unclassified Frankia]MBL7493785.1 orotidine-5'-phosphate decarboxylase [Frankia sp. AgW1.1]MBL7549091.1 orotidine-5'-phosphate decarboxylase [Frankia sp. AgB1.9]MBL7619730.1 orotidine-5'-phosphate decarboxylase [Frankia sp. AgB1.8]
MGVGVDEGLRTGRAPVAVPLDTSDVATALRWARAVAPHVAVLKVGMELFYREGPAVVATLRAEGLLADPGEPGSPDAPGLFLDLKLHDIPATVAGAIRSVARLRPQFVTVHAAGGPAMLRAAVEAANEVAAEAGTAPLAVAGVTVLTSLSEADLTIVGLAGPALDAARRLARLAVEAGATALVASPWEAEKLREEVGNNVTLITPGVRPAGGERADQARVATPEEALAAGADLVVMGRPITGAADPGAVAAALAATLGHLL